MSLVLALALLPQSHAAIFAGNPELFLFVDRPAHDFASVDVELDKVRMHACEGGYTDYQVDGPVDLVDGHVLAIAAGDWCGITVYWSSVMTLTGTSSAFVLEYDVFANALYIASSGDVAPVGLAPFEVVSGSYSGANPALFADIR